MRGQKNIKLDIIIYSKFISKVERNYLPREKQEVMFVGKPVNTP
jgi:hypothetical protein